jgi:hypothetical protein
VYISLSQSSPLNVRTAKLGHLYSLPSPPPHVTKTSSTTHSLVANALDTGKTTLRVAPSVDEVWVVESKLHAARNNVVDSFDSLHKAIEGMLASFQEEKLFSMRQCSLPVILVANLVLPSPEASTRENILVMKVGKCFRQGIVALKSGRGISVIESTDVGADNLVLMFQQVGVDQALNTLLEQGLVIDGLE